MSPKTLIGCGGAGHARHRQLLQYHIRESHTKCDHLTRDKNATVITGLPIGES